MDKNLFLSGKAADDTKLQDEQNQNVMEHTLPDPSSGACCLFGSVKYVFTTEFF